ncbi:hypothetical protein MFU01_06920 [Myxococcus fulvus]|uniref:Lipoprotein n=1 Tax=Myxococcus fulvus TaxID=33 RepID=A0A511SUQ9_MYXFU|nr:hypothetical protein MFU01_06920 [Myxococcus fulvus]
MSLKALLVGIAAGFLAACGGMENDPAATPAPEEMELSTVENALCEGWDRGARSCCFKCTSSSEWTCYAPGAIGWGQCTDQANAVCGRTAYGVCWSF